ncbi:MAG: hypothetical protein K5771_05330 [Oscillospiraceae bacterium]|nr:hypothetical protein [Oscillospiraceae bacterium]
MDKWIKKLSSAVIASVLALTLSSKAYAEPPKEEKKIPSDDPSMSDGLNDTDKENTTDSFINDASAGSSEAGDVKGGDDKGGDDKGGDDKGGDDKGGDDKGGEIKSGTDGTIYIDDDNNLDGNDKIESFPSSESEAGNGWSNSDGTLTLHNYTGDSITSQNCNININASGVNQIGYLNANGSGDVYFSGTGIVLVDSFNENNNFILQPIGGTTTVPAVFLRGLSGYNTDDYVLINDSKYPGILDAQYVMPDGINLVMPSGTKIELTSPEIDISNLESTDADYYSTGYMAGLNPIYGQENIITSCLTIPEKSTLTINNGATVSLAGKVLTHGKVAKKGYENAYVQTPVLDVRGNLNGNGEITGDGILVLSGKNLKNTVNSIPSINANVSVGPNIFKIYDEDKVILYNRLYFELSGYVSSRNYLTSNDKKIIYQPPYDPSHDNFGNLITPVFGYSNENETDFWPEGDCISCKDSFKEYSSFHWWLIELGQGGGEEYTPTSTSAIGSGKLGGKNAGAISLVLKVTDKETYYNLSAYLEEKQIFELGNIVTVRFDYPAPTADGQLFAVFRNEDGSLTAFPARYDAITGQLVFNGDKLGNFVVVCIDYEGKLYTKEFYDFLETIESVKELKYGL